MKLEIRVKRVSPDEGLIVDENDREWSMVEVRHDSGEPYWQIETKVEERLIYGTYDDVVIHVKSWTEISRYMQK
ncbi:MAG: hypothetical protein HY913_04330 [Desulfomonile tiedjei]|nr:hypothetical protein [Desulfomonile tiedjei]